MGYKWELIEKEKRSIASILPFAECKKNENNKQQ